MTEELYTRRNIAECMNAAWTLLSTNISRVTKALWLPALLFAIINAFATPFFTSLQLRNMQEQKTIFDLVSSFLFVVLFFLAGSFINAKTFKLVNEQNMHFCFNRSLKTYAISYFLAFVFIILLLISINIGFYAVNTGKLGAITTLTIFSISLIILTLLFLILYSPFSYVFTKYMVEPGSKLKHIWIYYKIGFKNINFIITFLLLSCILVGIVYGITALPSVIVMLSARYSNEGILNGDPSGLPGYFPILNGAVGFITSFIITILMIWFAFAQYYMYASIETKNGCTELKTTEIKE